MKYFLPLLLMLTLQARSASLTMTAALQGSASGITKTNSLAPTFSPNGGLTYQGFETNVTITSAGPSPVNIYWTTNGDDPLTITNQAIGAVVGVGGVWVSPAVVTNMPSGTLKAVAWTNNIYTLVSSASTATFTNASSGDYLTETNNLMVRFISTSLSGSNNGDAIGTWPEYWGRNATASSTARPIYVNDAATNINGFPVVRPDGVNDEMAFTETNLTFNCTIYAVARRPASTKLIPMGGNSTHSYAALSVLSDDKFYMAFSDDSFTASATTATTNGVHIWTWTSHNSNGIHFYIDQSEFGTGGTWTGGNWVAGKLFTANGVIWGAGEYAEILAFIGQHTDAQRTNVWTSLKNHYGTP